MKNNKNAFLALLITLTTLSFAENCIFAECF